MIKQLWNQIQEKQDIRQSLSKIRQEIKDPGKLQLFRRMLEGEEERLISLLRSEDAKTRKNAALLMGDLGSQEFLAPVFEAYRLEEQRFVRSAYLSAIGKFDYSEYLPELKERREVLDASEVTDESRKHVEEELRELSSLVIRAEGIKPHRFTGWKKPQEIILLTNRNFTELTERELIESEPNAKTQVFGAGVRARVENLNWVDSIRTYQELLFVVKGMENAPMDASRMAEKIVDSDLLPWLLQNHDGGAPYYFRVEMKSRQPLDEKSAFVKKLSGQIERLSKRTLTNAAANYEFEIRVIENKEGRCNLLVKLYTWKDRRFLYRREFMPSSIRPVHAALAAALAKDYLKEGAQVLDPFCGVGTMLVERHRAVKAKTAYGVDIQEEAVEKARRNTQAAGQIVHYINRDFFRFEHEYLFDEVFTNMPFQLGKVTEEDVRELYQKFFGRISRYLTADARLVLYSHNQELVEKFGKRNGFRILEKYEISKREGTYVFIISM